jgi:hypothetical protein
MHSSSPLSCYMPCPSLPPWLGHSNYTWRRSPLMIFRNKLIFYGEELIAPRQTPKLEDHPLSMVRPHLIYSHEMISWKAAQNILFSY